ncbi:hypothetical protein [Methylocapsa palsarum]|uniref:Uncharacterized protein n=2 Tax=Methylocapsa palsarum TaxID=1612308 RepID=A0A1I3ZHH7_9HYPH|nr:hypothetical protein [Methylocapsa palsarum]SFK43564.1 hypothetical protein SAMN05444581_1083 [Methylocapsa palsarum]
MSEPEWNSTTTPEEGSIVHVLAEDDFGQYPVPFRILFKDDRWWNAHTGEELEVFVAGWREASDTD